MVSKAIIEDIETSKVNGEILYQYSVRIPIFHGYGGTDSTPSKYLPKAVYCTMPHMEQTKLSKGDIVWVAIEDFDLSQIVILGMIPISSTKSLYGSSQTQSGVVVDNVQSFTSSREGTVELPPDTKIWITKETNKTITGDDYVDGEELSYLNGVEGPIQDQINGVKSVSTALAQRFQMKATIKESYGTNSGVEINSDIWVTNSGMLNTEKIYMFTYQNSLWSVVDPVTNKKRTFTRQTLRTTCGITYRTTYPGATIKIVVNMSPLGIQYGGTGAETAKEACAQLHTFQTELVSESRFAELEKNKELQTATVYYIYQEEKHSGGGGNF